MKEKIKLSEKVDKIFPTRQANCLMREGIYTIKDLLDLKCRDIIQLPGIGKKTLRIS